MIAQAIATQTSESGSACAQSMRGVNGLSVSTGYLSSPGRRGDTPEPKTTAPARGHLDPGGSGPAAGPDPRAARLGAFCSPERTQTCGSAWPTDRLRVR
ncbi:hypothetical protein MKOR_08220 [Mycolicibacillus koreensis]|nr:hypothetical protein MKOR_08220 [Mycolicibacillus koreensis]